MMIIFGFIRTYSAIPDFSETYVIIINHFNHLVDFTEKSAMHFQHFRLSQIVINDLFQCAHFRGPINFDDFIDFIAERFECFFQLANLLQFFDTNKIVFTFFRIFHLKFLAES